MTIDITMSAAMQAYTAGNNRGEGYAPYTDVAGTDTVAEAIRAFAADGWEVVLRAANDSEVTVLANGDGELVGVGNANGAWAVPLREVSR